MVNIVKNKTNYRMKSIIFNHCIINKLIQLHQYNIRFYQIKEFDHTMYADNLQV